jgi:DNA anti-recombination protein RmuC
MAEGEQGMMATHVSRAEEPANQRPFYAKPSAATFSSDKIKLFNTLMTDVGESNTMNAMTREEMTARLELVEAKADARLGRLEERLDQAISEMRRESAELMQAFKEERGDRSSDMRHLKLTIITTGVAVVVGLWAANVSMVQSMLASFESGKSSATAITQATEQLKQTQQQMQSLQDALVQGAKSR